MILSLLMNLYYKPYISAFFFKYFYSRIVSISDVYSKIFTSILYIFMSRRYLKLNISRSRLQVYSSKFTLSFLATGILDFQILFDIHIFSISISDSLIDLATHSILNILLFILKYNALSPTFS